MNALLEKIRILEVKLETEKSIDSFRLLHGRGRCFSGLEFLNVDFFQPVLLLIFYKAPPEKWLDQLVDFLRDKLTDRLSCVLAQDRYLTNAPSRVLLGVLPEPIFARRRGLVFKLHLNTQQNSGFFLDMESGRQWVERNAVGRHVLNLFAYTCAFSVVAIAAGAEKVVNVDMSSSALNLGRANHQYNALGKVQTEFVAENILKSWGRIKKRGPYDMVIIDPPSYQKGSFIAEKDYAKIIRRLPELMPQGGLILACLNAPELTLEFLKAQFLENFPAAKLVERLEPHADFPDVNVAQQLKLLVYSVSEKFDPPEKIALCQQ
jgi:23S rRNA (cytosine1962-C5)-methyltransferase